MTAWQTILFAVTGNALALAVLGWLAKSLLGTFLSKDLDKHRAALSAANQASGDRLRHELSLIANERNIVFSALHQRRADAISGAYERIVEAARRGASYASPIEFGGEPSKQEKYTSFVESYNDLVGYFGRSRIYVPKSTCSKIDQVIDQMKDAAIEMNVYMRRPDEDLGREGQIAKMEAWSKSWKCFKDQIPVAKEALESDLRVLLGDSEQAAS